MLAVLATTPDSPSLSYSPSGSGFSLNSLASDEEDQEKLEIETPLVNLPVTTSWTIKSTLTKSVVPLLNPQNWSRQTQAGVAFACVAPCAAFSFKAGAIVLTTIACLPRIASYYSSTKPKAPKAPTQTTQSQEANWDWYLTLKINWFKDHEKHEDMQQMQEECPLTWLITGNDPELPLEEKAHYQGLILYYNTQIKQFHTVHKKALQVFKNSYAEWHTNLKGILQSYSPRLDNKWTNLSIEEAKNEVAKECQEALQLHKELFQQTLLVQLKEFYKNLLKIPNHNHPNTPDHPYITAQVDRALHEATFNYLQLEARISRQVTQITRYILSNWSYIATSRQESQLPLLSPCDTCMFPLNQATKLDETQRH